MNTLEFWFDPASTYSWLSAARLDGVAEGAGVATRWRPFLLGPIFKAQGWDNSPFNLYPAKGRYMWRDMERQCAALGLRLARPDPAAGHFPRNSLLAARCAVAALEQDWGRRFVRETYRAQFSDLSDIADPAVLSAIARRLGQDGEKLLAQAQSDAVKAQLRANTEEAQARGIFGAPFFLVGDEPFWGNDRLEEAVRWAAGRGQA